LTKIRPIDKNSPNRQKFAQLTKIRPICKNLPNRQKIALSAENRPIGRKSPKSGHPANGRFFRHPFLVADWFTFKYKDHYAVRMMMSFATGIRLPEN
jgi:hypothetical protein